MVFIQHKVVEAMNLEMFRQEVIQEGAQRWHDLDRRKIKGDEQ